MGSRVGAAGRLSAVGIVLLCVALLTFDNVKRVKKEMGVLIDGAYINFLPLLLKSKVTNDTIIALTEAGRLAYWLPGKKYDLIGLNTPETAVHGPSVSFLRKTNPDLIFIHTAKTVRLSCQIGIDVCLLEMADLEKAVLYSDIEKYAKSDNRVKQAPLATFEFLLNSRNSYDLVLARYRSKFNHLYAVKKQGIINSGEFVRAIESSFSDSSRRSYLDALQSGIPR